MEYLSFAWELILRFVFKRSLYDCCHTNNKNWHTTKRIEDLILFASQWNWFLLVIRTEWDFFLSSIWQYVCCWSHINPINKSNRFVIDNIFWKASFVSKKLFSRWYWCRSFLKNIFHSLWLIRFSKRTWEFSVFFL